MCVWFSITDGFNTDGPTSLVLFQQWDAFLPESLWSGCRLVATADPGYTHNTSWSKPANAKRDERFADILTCEQRWRRSEKVRSGEYALLYSNSFQGFLYLYMQHSCIMSIHDEHNQALSGVWPDTSRLCVHRRKEQPSAAFDEETRKN